MEGEWGMGNMVLNCTIGGSGYWLCLVCMGYDMICGMYMWLGGSGASKVGMAWLEEVDTLVYIGGVFCNELFEKQIACSKPKPFNMIIH